jgi:hypothetical protein
MSQVPHSHSSHGFVMQVLEIIFLHKAHNFVIYNNVKPGIQWSMLNENNRQKCPLCVLILGLRF